VRLKALKHFESQTRIEVQAYEIQTVTKLKAHKGREQTVRIVD
jgi:hypothetical protein